MDLFFDTSGLAKHYIVEVGSAWVKNICSPTSGNNVFIAEITAVEITSAIVRRRRRGSLTSADAQAALAQFDIDLTKVYFLSEIASARLSEARRCAETHGLRALDAIPTTSVGGLFLPRPQIFLPIALVCAK